ncbi:MAG: ATP-binding protein [Kiloniellales bacterium]
MANSSLLLVAAIAALAILGLAVLAFRYRQQSQRAEAALRANAEALAAAEARLDGAPVGYLLLESESQVRCSARLAAWLELGAGPLPLSEVVACFAPADGQALSRLATDQKRDGRCGELALRQAKPERRFQVEGRRLTTGGRTIDLLWFHEVTALAGALERSENDRAAFTALLEALPLPVWRRDRNLALLFGNRAYAEAVDAGPDAIAKKQLELLGTQRGSLGKQIGRRALESGQEESETLHVVVGGQRRLMQVAERPLGDGGLAGFALDRTAVEELEGELARHIEAHADVLENLGSAIAIFGPDLKLKFFNTAFASLWRLNEAFLATEPEMGDVLEAQREARGLPEQSNFPEYKRERVRVFQTLIEPREELIHQPNGNTLRMVAIPHPFGGVLLNFEDVTDRLTLERSYNTLIEVQRETLNKLYEGVAVYGADGRLKLSNPAFARIWSLHGDWLGGDPHVRDVIGQIRDFFDVSDEVWPKVADALVAQATEAEPASKRLERADGSVIDWAQVPLPDGASLFTYLDVTDSIRVERALMERNEALETADRLKSEFIANISYELRTPLNAIVGFAEILENQFFGPLNERQRDYSHAIVESSQQLISLINDILDLATIEAGYMKLDVTEFDLGQLFDSLRTLGHERARNQNIGLSIHLPPDLGTLVGDGRRLRQALFNLLSNALKFTPSGGEITLSAERMADEVLLAVADTGIGIPMAEQARVFGKFERGGGVARQSGAGLGLSLVKSLIELHGGWVDLESEPGQGTRVTCHLPVRPQAGELDGNDRNALSAPRQAE